MERALMKYKDIIADSVRIHSGSPAVYQLKPKTVNINTLRKITLGERNVNKINKTILLVGETGTGKSTLINALVNYAMGLEWEDDVWFQIVEDKVEEGEKRSQSKSQTSDVIMYQIFGFEDKPLPYSLTIIDTPGYGDTRGIEKDDNVNQRLLDWFSSDDGVHEINAVGLVLKATENRLNDRVRYVFDSVVSLFGKNMEKNIFALMTHSDYLPPENALEALKNAKIKCATNDNNEILYFQFNNRQSIQKTPATKFALKCAWDFTTDQLGQFTDFLRNTAPQKLNTTIDVLKERNRLTACIKNLRKRVEFIELKQREVQQERELLRKYEADMKKNENYVEEVDEVTKVKTPIEGGRWGFLWLSYKAATSCLVCEETCHHEGCIHASGPDDNCAVMKNGHCTVCTGKCSTKVHVKEKWIYEIKTEKVKRTIKEMKEKYEKNKEDSESQLSLLESLNKKLEELQRDKDKWLEESFQHVVELEQIALKVDSLSTLVHLDFLIDEMEEKGDRVKLQKLEEMKSRVGEDDGIRKAVEYMCGARPAADEAVPAKKQRRT